MIKRISKALLSSLILGATMVQVTEASIRPYINWDLGVVRYLGNKDEKNLLEYGGALGFETGRNCLEARIGVSGDVEENKNDFAEGKVETSLYNFSLLYKRVAPMKSCKDLRFYFGGGVNLTLENTRARMEFYPVRMGEVVVFPGEVIEESDKRSLFGVVLIGEARYRDLVFSLQGMHFLKQEENSSWGSGRVSLGVRFP